MSDINNDELDTGPGLERYAPPPGVVIGNYKDHPSYQRTPQSKQDELRALLSPGHITDRIVMCHGAAWDAGWWHDLRTGAVKDRNNGEMLMLMVSEVCEGAHGLRYGLMDDKIKHRRMLEVELADFLIREYDFCGARQIDLQYEIDAYVAAGDRSHLPDAATPALFRIVQHLSNAMEGDRKGNSAARNLGLVQAHQCAIWYGGYHQYDLHDAIVEKVRFNATRADHKPENRLAPGGKAY
jgi:hypothetical protein